MVRKYLREIKYGNMLCLGAVLLITGVLFFLLEFYTPLYADDYSYLYSFETGERISSLQDIIKSQTAHYYDWTGRVFVHALDQVFLLLGKYLFNFINTISFLVLGVLIFFHGTESRLRDRPLLLSIIYCSLFLFTPAFGQSFLWVTGASNYLYGIAINLIYLIPFRCLTRRTHVRGGALKAAGMLLLGFLAGGTNENNAIALIAIVCAFILYYRFHHIRLSAWMFSGLAGNIAGCFFMLSAPGQWNRMESVGGINFKEIFKNIFKISVNIVDYFGVILLFILLGTVMYESGKNTKKTWSFIRREIGEFTIPLIYGLGFCGVTYSMIVSPSFPERAWSSSVVYLLSAAIALWSVMLPRIISKEFLVKMQRVFVKAVVCGTVLLCLRACYNGRKIYLLNKSRESIIEECIKSGQREVYIPTIQSTSKYSCFDYAGDLNDDSEDWPNTVMAKYYGVDKIIKKDTAGDERE